MIEKALEYLHPIFAENLHELPVLSTISVVAVTEPPEPYSICHGMIMLDRNQLIGEKDYSDINEFYHMICFCLVYQYYGIIVQPLTWSDSWISIGVSSFLSLEFIGEVFRYSQNRSFI